MKQGAIYSKTNKANNNIHPEKSIPAFLINFKISGFRVKKYTRHFFHETDPSSINRTNNPRSNKI